MLNFSLSEDVLAHVVSCSTSWEVWSALERMFSSTSQARILTIWSQLSSLKKGNLSISDYFQWGKSLSDVMAAVGHLLHEIDIISYSLVGLDSSYDPLVASINTQLDPLSLEDIYSYMLSFELRLATHTSPIDATIDSVNVVTHNDK